MDSLIKNEILGVVFYPLKIINTEGGDVLHCLKSTDLSFKNFGEAYFSTVKQGYIKGWKRHFKMTLNLTVICGRIKIVTYDDRFAFSGKQHFAEYILGPKINYGRLTIEPGIWVAFQGLDYENILINISNIIHDPEESEKKNIEDINFKW